MNSKSFWLIGASAIALLSTPAMAQDEPADTVGEDIVVQGFREALESAQAVKRDSDQIVDSVVAEDIGKLPDQTVAESVARITGVSVERSNGEASSVRVRGLPDLTTTYNGREVFTAQGRYVQLQDFPSGTIGRIDVYKTSAANLPEAGIAGEIDLKAQKPFNFKDMRIAGGIAGVHWRQSQRVGYDANLLVSNRWDTGNGEIGFLVGGSYAVNYAGDSLRQTSQTIQTRTTAPVGIRYPAEIAFDTVASNRNRPSISAVLQWRPSPDLELYGDFLYQGFHSEGGSRTLRAQAGTGATVTDVVFCPGSTLNVCQMTANGAAGNPVTSGTGAQGSDTNTYHAGGGFIWKLGGTRITGDVGYTDSTFTTAAFVLNARTNIVPARQLDFADPAGGGAVQIVGVNLADPASWRLMSFNESGSQASGKGWQGRLDADIPLELSIFDKLQIGVRYTGRDARSEAYTVTAQTYLNATAPQIAALQFTAQPLSYYNVPPAFKGDEANFPRTWYSPTRDSVYDNRGYLRSLIAGRSPDTPTRTPQYFANERTYAAYAQTHYDFDVGSVRIDGQIGIRAVRTENDLRLSVAGPTTTSSYEDYLPNVSARIRLTPKLQARAAFTMTSSRPGFNQFNPVLNVQLPCSVAGAQCFTSGNPALQPIKSKNYDASLEYYFSRSGSATVQIFRREVDGFISTTQVEVNDPTLGLIYVTRPENAQSGYMQGVEVGFRTFLKVASLPQWMQNFGVLANYTYLDHGAELPSNQAALKPGIQPLPNTSSHLANAQVFYETKTLSLRASYNYRSSFQEYRILGNAVVRTIERGRGILDLSASISPTDFMSLSFSASNVLNTPVRNFSEFTAVGDGYDWQVGYRESVYRIGARFRF